MPQNAAGSLTDHPVSVPNAAKHSWLATLAAEPELDHPAILL